MPSLSVSAVTLDLSISLTTPSRVRLGALDVLGKVLLPNSTRIS